MSVLRFAVSALPLLACVALNGQSQNNLSAGSEVQASFTALKSLAGNWEGSITTDDPQATLALMKALGSPTENPTPSSNRNPARENLLPLSIRVASHGNALIHELNTGSPEVTVIYMEGDHLALVHYCDFGNRPHMIARPSTAGRVVQFDLADFSGSDQIGHVSRGDITVIDTNHHTEDWTFMLAGGKILHAHLDFKRVP